MATRRLQVGTFVMTKKKVPSFGKVVGEVDKKRWHVRLCSGETETKSSGQLIIVDQKDLPSIAIEYFRLAPAVSTNAATISTDRPPPISTRPRRLLRGSSSSTAAVAVAVAAPAAAAPATG